jgi:hypothetical protein
VAGRENAVARRGATEREAVRLGRLLGGGVCASRGSRGCLIGALRLGHGKARGGGRAVRRRAGAMVRRRGVPGAGRRAARILGTPRRACHLGMEQVRWEDARRRVDRGTAREGAGRRRRGLAKSNSNSLANQLVSLRIPGVS